MNAFCSTNTQTTRLCSRAKRIVQRVLVVNPNRRICLPFRDGVVSIDRQPWKQFHLANTVRQ